MQNAVKTLFIIIILLGTMNLAGKQNEQNKEDKAEKTNDQYIANIARTELSKQNLKHMSVKIEYDGSDAYLDIKADDFSSRSDLLYLRKEYKRRGAQAVEIFFKKPEEKNFTEVYDPQRLRLLAVRKMTGCWVNIPNKDELYIDIDHKNIYLLIQDYGDSGSGISVMADQARQLGLSTDFLKKRAYNNMVRKAMNIHISPLNKDKNDPLYIKADRSLAEVLYYLPEFKNRLGKKYNIQTIYSVITQEKIALISNKKFSAQRIEKLKPDLEKIVNKVIYLDEVLVLPEEKNPDDIDWYSGD